MSTPIEAAQAMIATERARQRSEEGWTDDHDDEHADGQLFQAATCYACWGYQDAAPDDWPWDEEWWKPSPDPVRSLVKAGALYQAEIDRLEREARETGFSRGRVAWHEARQALRIVAGDLAAHLAAAPTPKPVRRIR